MPLPVSCSTKSQILGDYQIKKKKNLGDQNCSERKRGLKLHNLNTCKIKSEFKLLKLMKVE
jgi:hypothetical protein